MDDRLSLIGGLVKSFFWFAGVQVVVGLFAIVVAVMGLGGLFAAQNKQQAGFGETLVLAGGVLSVLAAVLFVMGLAAGMALRMGWSWGPGMARWTTYLALLEFPVGTAFAVYWLRSRGR